MPSQFFFLGLIFSVLLTSVMDSRQKKTPCPRETQYFGLFFNNQASKVFTLNIDMSFIFPQNCFSNFITKKKNFAEPCLTPSH